MMNSGFLDGLDVKEAIERMFAEIEARGIGREKANYRLRDATFSRQRYWGAPFPIYYKYDTACPLPEDALGCVKLPAAGFFAAGACGR